MQVKFAIARWLYYPFLKIDHFHIRFETEALSLTERQVMMSFFRKQTLHDFSTSTTLAALFGIER